MTEGRAAACRCRRVAVLSLGIVLALLASRTWADGTAEDAAAHEVAGRLSEAADAWRRIVTEDATDLAALGALASSVLRAPRPDLYGEVEAALEAALETATDAEPADPTLRVLLGQVLLAQARTTTSTGIEQAAAVRARAAFEAVLAVDPTNEAAPLGLAHALELGGKMDEAIAALDRGLAVRAEARTLVTEKGRILYDHAVHAHKVVGRTYPLSADLQRAFRRAQGALLSAGEAAPKDVDSWLRLAWASQVLGEVDQARHGYRMAIVAAPENPLPLRGLSVLYANDPAGYEAELVRMAKDGPPFDRVLLLQARDRLSRKELSEAERILDAFLAAYPESADGLYDLGELRLREGRGDDARALFRRAVEADGDHLAAADRVDRFIRRDGLQRAKESLDAAFDIEAEYTWLLERTPRNPFVRNNIAFLLREAWLAHKADPAWRPVLDAAVSYYDDAVRVIGPWTPEKHRALPWTTRHAYAQIVNDTGVIRHLYEPTRDLARAEHDYLQAMRYAEWGYADAWTYLRRIYQEQERWQELHRLACRAAEGLADAKGEPLLKARAAARSVAERLVAEGKVE